MALAVSIEQTLRVDPDPDPDPEIDVEVDEAEDATTTGADDTNDTGGTAGVETGVPEPDLGAEPGSGDIEPDTGTSPTA
jgi:hypothetical protein